MFSLRHSLLLSAGLENVIYYTVYQVLKIKMPLNPLPKHARLVWYLTARQCIMATADIVPGNEASAKNDGE